MPTCRLCSSTYPREYFIHGNGPRKDVCVRCGVDHGYIDATEAPSLFDKSTAEARFGAYARRWSPVLWLSLLWILWGSLMSSIEVWGIFTLILLLIATLFTPFSMIFLSRSKHQATIQRLTPDYERPPGH